ncbi:uncharacterized protein PRCAT00002883001 [Priceomyces carsonii]|uniref:uncharacterized protein n=1 Tax=Priceomyces carsonii TaxID=28549 RepID=UPI002ED86345|nr:unnamed protein product [Priceomyces carsonii]
MSEFSGLGIVMEEHEPETKRQSIVTGLTDSEVLLPPLPDEEGFESPHTIDTAAESSLDDGSLDESRRDSEFSNFISQRPSFSNYELGAPSLLDNILILSSPTSTTFISKEKEKEKERETKDNPLKRLKSLKKGLRNLSLSSSSNPKVRPTLSPLQTHTKNLSNDSSISTIDSIQFKANRSRTHSTPTSLTAPVTPPIASPMIMLSENIACSKKSFSDIEKTFFETISLDKIFDSNEDYDIQKISSIDELKTAKELIRYSSYLKFQRKSMVDAFELTKSRLQGSGWCSEYDLHSLQLQQDSLFCDIDTKLLQTEERLNREFNLSCMGNSKTPKTSGKSSSRSSSTSLLCDMPDSPSLKILESRCFSIADL